uniref:Uncharacterized protein n=2 Tax=Oryza meridionalis TaxID=40149 RepID=A0A0E0F7G1_9ORYZ
MLAVGSSCAALRCAVHSSPTPSTNPPPPRRRFHRFSRRRDGRRRDAPLPSSASSGHGLAATSSFPGSSSPSAHWRRAASSPGTSPPPRRTEEAAVGVRRRRRIPGLAAEVEQRALASGRDAAVLEFYSPWLRLCASLQGLVRELEDGAGGWTGFAIADAEDDRWLAEQEVLSQSRWRWEEEGRVRARRKGDAHWWGEWEELRSSGHGRKGWVLIDLMVNTWWRMCVPNNSSLQFFNIVDHAKTAIDARNKKTV